MRWFCTSLLCCVVYMLLPALAPAQGKDFYFTRLTSKDDLTDNHVNCIYQDRAGFIWVGTVYGLNRYNGYTVEHFINNPADTASISDNYITSIAQDKNGVLWIGTVNGGLNAFNLLTQKFTHYRTTGGLATDGINTLLVDSSNRLVIGYFGKGWSIYDQQKKTFAHYRVNKVQTNAYSRNMYDNARGLVQDGNGNLWVATEAGLYCQNTTTSAITEYRDKPAINNNSFADNLFTSIYLANDTTIWLGTWAAGIKKFNTRTHSFTQYLYDAINPVFGVSNIVLQLTRKSPSELWVATYDKGLGILNEVTGTFSFLANDPSNANSALPGECSYVSVDRQGSLWAGYYTGIARWADQSANFQFYDISNYNKRYSKFFSDCFYKDTATGLLYTGGEAGKGLYVIDEATGNQQVFPFTDKRGFAEENYQVFSIERLDENHLLLLTGGGPHIFNIKTKALARLNIKDQDGRDLPWGYNLMKAADGTWWYNSAGIYKIDAELTKAYRYHQGIYPGLENLNAILYIENPATIWINNNIKGLQLFNSITGKIEPVVLSNGKFGIREVATVLPVAKDEYWVTSFSQGLYRLHKNNNNTFAYTHYGEDDNVPSAFIKAITKDRNGNYWIATRKGPVMYNTQKKQFKLFGEQDGFDAEKWSYDGVYASPGGELYFTAVNGYARADVDSLVFNNKPAPLVFTSLKVAGKEWEDTIDITGNKEIDLPYNQNFFTAEFALLNYIDGQHNKYAYMLSGVDNGFVNAGARRYVSYADLKPGSYTLRIKAANNDGVWNDKVLTLAIVIQPPFWRTWAFYVVAALVLGGLVFTAYRYHINTIRKEEKLKTDFTKKVAEVEMKALRAQMNPHFIFNCLNSINRYIIKSDHITASGYLTRFAKLIRLILDNSIADTTSLDNEIQLVHLYLEMEQLRFDNRFTYSIETDPGLQYETTRIPSMLIQPYIENAIWHGLLHKQGVGHVAVRFKLHEKNILNIEIEDDGIGRQKSTELKSKNALKNKSYGMRITGDRINIVNKLYNMNATTMVEDLVYADGLPAGTKISLFIPFEITEIPHPYDKSSID